MFSRRKSNKVKVKVKPYIKEQDPLYCGLLKLACVSDQSHYSATVLEQAIVTLNSLPDYVNVHQRIIPLLNAKARTLGIFEKLSERTRQLLILCTQQGIISELAKAKQLKQILEVLIAKNIPVILLKGVAFNNVLYSSDAPRTSKDIDLLVKKEHWHSAVAAVKMIMDPLLKDKKEVFDDLYESSFVPKSKIGAALDLHKTLTHPKLFNIAEETLWQASTAHPAFKNNNIRMLCAEHALLHQAIHAFKDMNFCNYNLVDSHQLISGLKPDLVLTVALAKEWGASLPCYYLLKNCAEVIGNKIDVPLLDEIKPVNFKQLLAGKLLRSSFRQATGPNKTFRYRVNQCISLFVFADSKLRAVDLLCLYLTSAIKQKLRFRTLFKKNDKSVCEY
jgi:hypothetical protein